MFGEVPGVVMVNIFTLGLGEPLGPLGVSGELVTMVTGSPLVPSEVSRELVTIVAGSPPVASVVSRELVTMVTESPPIPSEGSRLLAAVVTEGPLVPLKVSRELVVMVPPVIMVIVGTVGLLVSLEISWSIDDFLVETSWGVVESATGRPLLVAMEVSGEDTSLAI